MSVPSSRASASAPERVERYVLHGVIASGGMGAVHFAELRGAADFVRIVAAKRLHAQFAADPEFVAMFRDEARLSARIQHPNVVAPIDVVEADGELLVIFDYVHGESLSQLMKLGKESLKPAPVGVVAAIVNGFLRGLHGAHVATAADGESLALIHRDVSPQNVLVGSDGVARLIDFGVAKARTRLQSTHTGEVKGKLAYMAPELLRGRTATRQSDIYGAGVVLWEALTGARLFRGENEGAIIERVLVGLVDPPSKLADRIPEALDALTLRALETDAAERFSSAAEMADAICAAVPLASAPEVAEWVNAVAAEPLTRRANVIASIEVGKRAHGIANAASTLADGESDLTRRDAADAGASPGVGTARRRARLPLALGLALALALAALVLVAVSALPFKRSAPPTARLPALDPPPVAVATPPSPTPAPPLEPVASVPPSTRPIHPSAPSVRPQSRGAGAKPNADCALPYRLDAEGRKVYKRECL